MVKVQKPTPKTFNKVGTIDNPIKKKKHDIKKETKSKVGAVSIPDVAPPSKERKEKTKKLLAENVIDAKIAQKPGKKQKDKKSKEKIVTEPEKNSKDKSKNRPLVLAPPESPKPAPAPAPTPTPASGKHKNKKVKVQKSDAPAPAKPAFEKKKNKKQQKKSVNAGDASKAKVALKGSDQQPKQLTKAQKKKGAIKAYKKEQKKKGKKEKTPRPQTLEPVPFDEEKFHAIVNVENIKKIAKALKTQCEKEVADKKTSIFNDYHYYLNVSSFKIANCPKRIVKLSLKHSLVDKDDDVVIIVPDLKRGAKADYEPTIQHYEDLFREAGVEGLKIVPFNQLKTEYSSFEAVRKFSNTYDYFICDGRLVGQVAGFTGKIFQKPRTTFHSVRLENTKNIKSEIEKSLRRTAYKQINKGDLISIPVGTHKYTIQQLAENVNHVVSQLKNIYPGGLGNIRSLNLKIDIVGTSSLPFYISMAQPPAETPYVVGEREQRMLKLKKEANEVLSKFAMTKDAQIIKLSKEQVEQKRQVKEAKAALAAKIETPEEDGDGDDDDETPLPAKKAKKVQKVEAPQDDDDDGEVPAKKAKKEQKAEVEKDSKKKQVEEQAEPEDEDDDEDAENDSDDEDGDDDDGEDDDDVDDDDDEDGDGNGDVDEEGDDDDDEDDDDDDDDEGDDDEDAEDNEDSD